MVSFNILLQNLFVIGAILLLSGSIGIFALPWGYIAGTVFISIFFTLFLALKYRFTLFLKFEISRNFIQYLKNIRVFVAVDVFTRITPILERVFIGLTFSGAVMVVDFARKLMEKLVSTISTGLVTSSYSDLSKEGSQGNYEKVREISAFNFNLITLASVFILVPILFLRSELSEVIFLHGKMAPQRISNISQVMLFVSIGIYFQNVSDLLYKVYFSLKRIKAAGTSALFQFVLLNVLSLLFLDKLSYLAVPLAFTIKNTVNFILYYFILIRGKSSLKFIDFGFAVKAGLLAAITYLALYFSTFYIEGSYLKIGLSCLIFSVLFILVSRLLRIDEVNIFMDKLLLRLKRKNPF
jgi:peptidoglycan biosynthesis protein MviN/MurJ (putative lipid II flippase)